MRTLTDALIAAQKSPSALPHAKVEIKTKTGDITLLTWTRLYTGTEAEPDNFHAAAMAGDGSLIRARVYANNLYRQRVANPGPTSDYTSWTNWGVTSYAVAMCAYGANVLAFRIGQDGHLYRSESPDYGTNWGAWTDMGAIPNPYYARLACCYKNATEAIVLYTKDNILYRRRLTGGTWEAEAAWTNTVNTITGVAAAYLGDWNISITGTALTTLKPHVWSCAYGDGYNHATGAWTGLKELTMAETDSNVTYSFPSLINPDIYRLFFIETYTGSEAYSRPYWTHTPPESDIVANLWQEPVPFNFAGDRGLALTSKYPWIWLTRPDAVWRASLAPASVEITDDVQLIATRIEETNGTIEITLRNDDGRYNTPGTGQYEAIKPGSQIQFSPGYHTTSGVQVSEGQYYTITGWEHISQGPKSAFILYGSDGWTILDRWKARRQYTWATGTKNIFQLLSWIFARAGLQYSTISSSSALANHYPAFTINPGESGKLAVQRLLAMVPDVLRFQWGYGVTLNPLSSDPSQYTYGTTHAILSGKYSTGVKPQNRAQVFGSGVFTEDWDWDEISLTFDQITQVKDINLTTVAKAHERGATELRNAGIHAAGGNIQVPLNCGQEIYDVIDITDALAGLSAAKKRVLSLNHLYHPAKGQYLLKIGLGAV